MRDRKLISVVISAYNEELVIEELSKQLKDVFDSLPQYDFEVIFVENGSTDRTYEKMLKVREGDSRFKILRLSRNFKMDGGITAGLSYAKGDAAVIMTANLQDTPSTIPLFVEKWEQGYENVYGIVKKRTGKGFFRRINSQLFYFLIGKLTGDHIPKNVSDFRLVDKKVYEIINSFPERNRFLRGMFAWVGFKSIGIEFVRGKRYAGRSHAHFFGVLQMAIRAIFAFSYVPIRFIAFLGFLFSAISILHLIYSVITFFIKGVPFAGFGTIVSLLLLMFGLLFLILGVIGQYIAQIYEEVKMRPNFIVSEKIGFD
ncbi:MAG: glycosyltransferase family 2 protein [bacterium]